jgi:lysophospholipase L1-like esterase
MIWVVLVAVAFVLGWNDVSSPPDTQASDPNPSSSFRIFALGDSYISGEGARSYFEGTDVPDNMCHRAKTAYPHLIAEKLGASLTFVACSGAVTKDVTGFDAAGNPVPGQHPQSPSDVFGGRPQVEILREAADGEDAERPDAVLISIGGNDAGFAEIGIDCATPLFSDCRDLASHWLRRLETDVYPALVRTDAAVREDAGGAPVFALTYPNPIGPHSCSLAGLNPAEMSFLGGVFVTRLNQMVRTAAEVAGIRVIDLSNAFQHYRFCEKPLGKTAVNFIEIEHTRGAPIDIAHLGGLTHGSLHPNQLGHELIEPIVLRRIEAVQAGGFKRPPAPQADNGPPPLTPEELGSPGKPPEFPSGTDCHGTSLAAVTQMSTDPDRESVSLSGLRPNSTVCFRTYRAEWESRRADSTGTVEVPIDVSRAGVASINEILVEEPGGVWKKLVVSRLGSADVG